MKYRVLATVACAAAVAFAEPVTYLAQEAGRAAEILARARQAIAGGKLDSLKTFTLQSSVQRNVGTMQLDSDVEIFLEMPDKYARVENTSGGPGLVLSGGGTTGFNGDRPLQKLDGGGMPGGGMVVRMGSGPLSTGDGGAKLTPEQIEQSRRTQLRSSRTDVSRLMLGWFAMAHPAAQAEYAFAGEAESVEGKAYVIDVKNADGFAARLFVDELTNLPLMVTYRAPQPRVISQSAGAPAGGHVVVQQGDIGKQIQELSRQEPVMADYTVYFEDWRDTDGVKFPFRMRRAMAGTTTEEWSVAKIRVNPKIDAKKFAVDSGS
jgi:hypothetical protein